MTDIKMPEVSGLEPIRADKERNQDIHIVILSGHSNFAYAQKAIELGDQVVSAETHQSKELVAVGGHREGAEAGRRDAPDKKQPPLRRGSRIRGRRGRRETCWCKRPSSMWRYTTEGG